MEFLQFPEARQLKENKLEQAIIDELQKFLLEMDKGFSFVVRQMRISTETSHFYVDLVFYNSEDLFHWDNGLENDSERYLKINADSNFFNGFKELALEGKIFG